MLTQNIHNGIAFTRNPIIVKSGSELGVSPNFRGATFSVTMDGGTIYTGQFYPPLSVDVAEIAEAYCNFIPDPQAVHQGPIMLAEDAEELSCRRMDVTATCGDRVDRCSLLVLPGGISTHSFTKLASTGSDIFDKRLLNRRGNFFFTTRTADWLLTLKETELFPLCFIAPEGIDELLLSDPVTRQEIWSESLQPGIYYLDLEAARRVAFVDNEILTNIFDISTGEGFAARIVIEQADYSRNAYRVKFRNSLGVFEIIELSGQLVVNPQYNESEDTSFQRYNSATGTFALSRHRLKQGRVLTLDATIPAKSIHFFLDMLSSEEVYLLDVQGAPLKVIPSAKDLTFKLRSEGPENCAIMFEVTDVDENITPDVNLTNKHGRFTTQFSNQFN